MIYDLTNHYCKPVIGRKSMTQEELKQRTKQFALRVIRLVDSLPRSPVGKILGNQLLRCGTSIGANYRAACRGRSTADFVAKLGIVIEESDESLYWMELILDSKLVKVNRMDRIMQEADELTAIFTAAVVTTKKKSLRNQKS